MQRCRSSRATSCETSRDIRCAASKPITRTGLLYWPSNKSSATLSMVLRHANGGGIGRSLAAAATLHCTMNTWCFLPFSSSPPRRRIKWRSRPAFQCKSGQRNLCSAPNIAGMPKGKEGPAAPALSFGVPAVMIPALKGLSAPFLVTCSVCRPARAQPFPREHE